MSSITNCPACQTQFVVTDEQLNQHNGKVRCGNCLNIFDATQHLVQFESPSESNSIPLDDAFAEDALSKQPQFDEAQRYEIEAPVASNETATLKLNETAISAPINITQPSIFDDLAGKSKLKVKNAIKKPRSWLILLLILILLLVAIAQSIYFLRSEIAIYYPNAKSFLVEICENLACSIDLPKKIELIVIDDSDIQEDANYAGLMRVSSTLINQAGFNQAYPNLELTLTDTEDKPKLRRIFKPSEYLATNTNMSKGLGAGEEVKVKLAITTQGETVSGYRVLVTY